MTHHDPDWAHLFQLGHDFRAISVAVGDRHTPLHGWRVFGYIGEHTSGDTYGPLHGPWRPTAESAIRAVHQRAVRVGRIPRGAA